VRLAGKWGCADPSKNLLFILRFARGFPGDAEAAHIGETCTWRCVLQSDFQHAKQRRVESIEATSMPNRSSLLVLGYLALAPLLLLTAGCYHESEFKGGLGITDNGVFSYPRYRAEVGHFPLKDGVHTYVVSGLPPDLLTLELFVNGSEAQRTQLTSASAQVTVSMRDASGTLVCGSNGNLAHSDGIDDHRWVLATSTSYAYYWDSDCRDIPIHRHKTYTITVHVSETESDSLPYELTVTLAGGGNELP
jgi:hypothetical protein